MTTVTLDLTNVTTTTASLSLLDPGQRERVLHVVRELVSADNDTAIMANIRETIAHEYPWIDASGQRRVRPDGTDHLAGAPNPVGVVFSTMDFDNGNFLTENGQVLFDNGDVDDLEFAGIDDLFTEEFGACGSNFTLGVDLRTGEMDGDDYAEENIHLRFGIAEPEVEPAGAEETQLDAAGLVAMLGEAGRDALREALHDADRIAAETALLAEIRDTLTRLRPGRTVAGVLFTADEEINLNYLSSAGLVVYTDGSTETVPFPSAGPVLVSQYGTGDADRSLAADLRTGEIVAADDTVDVHAHFELPNPAQH